MLTLVTRYAFPILVLYVALCLFAMGTIGSEFAIHKLFLGERQATSISFRDALIHPITRASGYFNVLALLMFSFAAIRDSISASRQRRQSWVDYGFVCFVALIPVFCLLRAVLSTWPGDGSKFIWVFVLCAVLSIVTSMLLVAAVERAWVSRIRAIRRWARGLSKRRRGTKLLILLPRAAVSGGAALIVLFFVAVPQKLHFVSIMHISLLLTFAYIAIAIWPPIAKLGLAISVVGVMAWASSEPFKYRFPNLHRDDGASLYNHPVALADYPGSTRAVSIPLIHSLERWKAQFSTKPTMVIIAASGGGYRSAYWTAAVLDSLFYSDSPEKVRNISSRNVRLLTGSSGGMVALTYFAVQELYDRGGQKPIANDNRRGIGQLLDYDLWLSFIKRGGSAQDTLLRDSLSPILEHLPADLFNTLWRGQVDRDRGLALEAEWQQLSTTFREYADFEKQGLVPSLIYTPILVEEGVPLLISNLDLSALQIETGHDLRNVYPIELFRLIPGSDARFRLATAARMGASFPFISPAVPLPTRPVRRVLDGGFYDNFGLAPALSLLNISSVREWLVNNVQGVVILEIRAYRAPSAPHGTEAIDDPCMAPPVALEARTRWFNRAFTFFLTPFETAERARRGAMLIRNSQMLQLVSQNYPEGFLRSVAFENSGRAGLTWIIGEDEVLCMGQGAAAATIAAGKKQLTSIFAEFQSRF